MNDRIHDLPPLLSAPQASARRFRPYGLLLLGALIAAALVFVTITQTASADRPAPTPVEEMQARGNVSPSPAGFVGLIGGPPFETMMGGVNATEEQLARMQELARAAREDVRRLARDAQRSQLDQVADAVNERVLIAMADISSVLTPAQRAQLSAEVGVLRLK